MTMQCLMRRLLPTAFILVLLSGYSPVAQLNEAAPPNVLSGKVVMTKGRNITVTLDSGVNKVRGGDRVELSFSAGGETIPVGSWQVTYIKEDGLIEAQPLDADDMPNIDMDARIFPSKEIPGRLDKQLDDELKGLFDSTVQPETIPFTVETDPGDARVRIMNIRPRYRDGIELKPGRYRIEATKEGYRKHLGWHELTADTKVYVAELEELPPPPPATVYDSQATQRRPPVVTSSGSTPSGARAERNWRDPVTGMEFAWVPQGCYRMGNPDTSMKYTEDERPVHEVCVNGFWLGKYEVTREQWRKVTGLNRYENYNCDSYCPCGSNCPVENISWNEVQDYIGKLNGKGGAQFRLPTEAEWEYACRSGGKDEKYSGSNSAYRVAWYKDNARKQTHRVGSKASNRLGLHDMSGNVREFVKDIYDKEAYSNHARNNPVNTGEASQHVLRGGSWRDSANDSRCAVRNASYPDSRYEFMGFRLVRRVN